MIVRKQEPMDTRAMANARCGRFALRGGRQIRSDGFGLSYYAFRYYVPLLGRWINGDPIGERGGLNLYAFVANNGVNGTDFLRLKIDGEFRVTKSYGGEARNISRDMWVIYINKIADDLVKKCNGVKEQGKPIDEWTEARCVPWFNK